MKPAARRNAAEPFPVGAKENEMTLTEPTAPVLKGRFVGAVDLHSHPLPAIDDGANTLADSLMMLRIAARFGTVAMVATPHRYWENGENTPDTLRRLTAQVQAALAEKKFGAKIELFPGQEIPLKLNTAFELSHGEALTLADRGRVALVEPPFDRWEDWTAKAIRSIVRAGFIPILAHPERNRMVQQNPELLADVVDAGAKFQLTAMSIVGDNGRRALSAAHSIIERGWATVIASDSHSPTWRPPTMRGAYFEIAAKYGEETARKLCIENPAALLRGDNPENPHA